MSKLLYTHFLNNGTKLTRLKHKNQHADLMMRQRSLRYDPNSYTVTANILPHTAGISCKTLISRSLSLPAFICLPPLCRQPTFLLSLSAKVAATFGLLQANLDFAASTWRGMQRLWLLWFQSQPKGLMSRVRFGLLSLWLQIRCLLCGCHMENERWDSRLCHTQILWFLRGADRRKAGQKQRWIKPKHTNNG